MTGAIIAVIAALGGIILLLGTLYLIYQGRITLQAISEKIEQQPDGATRDALAVEIGRIKVRSQYPTIVLFVLAVGCFWLALEYQKRSDPETIAVSGTLDDPEAKDYTVTFEGIIGMAVPDAPGGYFEQKVPKDVSLVILEVGKAGVPPQRFPVYPGKVTKWPVKCALAAASRTAVTKPQVDPSQITETNTQLPPLQTR
jgi:hypothetical protein